MATRLISFLKQRDIDACLERAQIPIRDWANAWCADVKPTLHCEAATDPVAKYLDGRWFARSLADGNLIRHYLTAGFEGKLEALMFRSDGRAHGTDHCRESQIAGGIASEAIEDLVSILMSTCQFRCSAKSEPAEAPPSWMYARSSGAALLSVHLGGEAAVVLIPASTPSRQRSVKIASPSGVTPLAIAMKNTPVRLIVELGSVEMTIANWASLALGDVIQLPFGTDDTLTVLTEGGRPICAANLGSLEGHRAIEVIKVNTH